MPKGFESLDASLCDCCVLAVLFAPVSCALFTFWKRPPSVGAGLFANKSEGLVLAADAKGLGACVDVDAGDSRGLLEPKVKPPGGGFALCLEKGLLESEGFPNMLEPALAPVVVLGGGPAGVVELPNRLGAGLLVGVVVFVRSAKVLSVPILLKRPPVLPCPLRPPNRLGAWLCDVIDVSTVLFGVENPAKPLEGAVVDGWLFCDPACPNNPPLCLFPPNRLLLLPPPNVGAVFVSEAPPKREFPPAVLVLPNGLIPDVVGGMAVEPNRLPVGFELLEFP